MKEKEMTLTLPNKMDEETLNELNLIASRSMKNAKKETVDIAVDMAKEERKAELIQLGEDRSQKNVLAQMVRAAVSGRTENRSLSLSGNNVTNDNVRPIIEELRPELVLAQAGVDVIDGSGVDKVILPYQSANPTASWLAENATLSDSEPTFTAIEAGKKAVGCLVKVSRQLLSAGNNIDSYIQSAIVRQVAHAIEEAAFADADVTNAFGALVETSGATDIVSSSTNGKTINSFDEIADLKKTLRENNVSGPISYFMAPSIEAGYGKLKDSENRNLVPPPYIFNDFIERGFVTSAIPTNITKGSGTNLSNLIALDPRDVKMVMTESVQIQLVERYADALQVGFLAYAFVDLKVLRSDSLALARGVKF